MGSTFRVDPKGKGIISVLGEMEKTTALLTLLTHYLFENFPFNIFRRQLTMVTKRTMREIR